MIFWLRVRPYLPWVRRRAGPAQSVCRRVADVSHQSLRVVPTRQQVESVAWQRERGFEQAVRVGVTHSFLKT